MTDLLLSPRNFIIHHGDTLLVTNRPGWIGDEHTGLFSRDTRYISSYHLTLHGFEPRFLGASRPHYFAATFYHTNPRIGTEPHLISENSLLLKISRHVRQGVHEDINLTNYAAKPVQLTLVLGIGADFADIFQVRELERIIPRMAEVRWEAANGTLSMHHRKGDFVRQLRYQLHDCTSPPIHSLGSLDFSRRARPRSHMARLRFDALR